MRSFLAIDWGTTNRRVYRIADGCGHCVERDGRGVLAMAAEEYPREIERLRSTYDSPTILVAGMAGSNRGWVDAGYVPAPATLPDLAKAAVRPMAGVVIIPGVSLFAGGRADVMRGEEVQFLGAVATGAVPSGARLCQPGTHCKWATVRGGALVDFTTAMTGEMFAMLEAHSLLGPDMLGEVEANEGFGAGIAESDRSDLLASLFGVRAATLLGRREAGTNAAFVSGLLIGTDARAHVQPGETVHILGDSSLRSLYAQAIGTIGSRAHLVDGEAAFVAGMIILRDLLQ